MKIGGTLTSGSGFEMRWQGWLSFVCLTMGAHAEIPSPQQSADADVNVGEIRGTNIHPDSTDRTSKDRHREKRRIKFPSINHELFSYARRDKFEEGVAAKRVKLLIEEGASPLATGLSRNVELSKLSALEAAIKRRRSVVLEALLAPPSPVSYEALEEKIQLFPAKRREVEIFRTKIARLAMEQSRHKDHSQDSSGEKLIEVITGAKIFIFAEEYMSSFSLLILYLVVVVLLVVFLYNLRIKQVPHTDVLLVPREEDTIWTLLRMCVSTLTTTIPTSNVFEIAGYGIALIGGVVWSEVYTHRHDLGLLLVLTSILQSILTLMCYMTYTPMVEPGHVALTPSVYKLMMYPKKSDWNRTLVRSSYYLLSCTVSFFIFVYVLTPIQKMYDCPTPSISDTYGFDYTPTRTVAVMWDVIIFFSLATRLNRTIDTFVTFDLSSRMFASSSAPYKEQDDVSVNNA